MPRGNTMPQAVSHPATRRDSKVEDLETAVRKLYKSAKDHLPFHGWHHIEFVRTKAVQFAKERRANPMLVAAAALVHDLNYVVRTNSTPGAGRQLRHEYLAGAGFGLPDIARVEEIINEAHTATRSESISPEGAALSDADTLFKALPMTPVVFSHLYLAENGIGLRELAEKIVKEQLPLMEEGIYFYDPAVRDRYIPWAEANMRLWQEIMDSLDDPDIVDLLREIDVKI
jgi:uncharacterized protein